MDMIRMDVDELKADSKEETKDELEDNNNNNEDNKDSSSDNDDGDEGGEDESGGEGKSKDASAAATKKAAAQKRVPGARNPVERYLRVKDEERHNDTLQKLPAKLHERLRKPKNEEEEKKYLDTVTKLDDHYKENLLEGYLSALEADWDVKYAPKYSPSFEKTRVEMNKTQKYDGRERHNMNASNPKDRELVEDYVKEYNGLRVDTFFVLVNKTGNNGYTKGEDRWVIALDDFPGLGKPQQQKKIGKSKAGADDKYLIELSGARCKTIGDLKSRAHNYPLDSIFETHYGLEPTQFLLHKVRTGKSKTQRNKQNKENKEKEKKKEKEEAAEEEEAEEEKKKKKKAADGADADNDVSSPKKKHKKEKDPTATATASSESSKKPNGVGGGVVVVDSKKKASSAAASMAVETAQSLGKYVEMSATFEQYAEKLEKLKTQLGQVGQENKTAAKLATDAAAVAPVGGDTLIARLVNLVFFDGTATAEARQKRAKNFADKYKEFLADSSSLEKDLPVIGDALKDISANPNWAATLKTIADDKQNEGKNPLVLFVRDELFGAGKSQQGRAVAMLILLAAEATKQHMYAETKLGHERTGKQLAEIEAQLKALQDEHTKAVNEHTKAVSKANGRITELEQELEKARKEASKAAAAATAVAAAASKGTKRKKDAAESDDDDDKPRVPSAATKSAPATKPTPPAATPPPVLAAAAAPAVDDFE